jgi:acid phosphatase type 7
LRSSRCRALAAVIATAATFALPAAALAATPPTNTSPPTISGTPRQGQLLTADHGQWNGTEPISYSYQWRRCTTVGSPCVDVPGATEQTFRLTATDVGATIVVAVTADNSALAGGGMATASSQPTAPVMSVPPPAGDPVVAAAGDVACDPASSSFKGGLGTSTSCRQKYTSDLLVGSGYTAVLALGDLQYECGGDNAFTASYEPSWGRDKSITRPAIGNHEYEVTGGTDCDTTGQATGYFDYFNGAGNQTGPAGDRSKGYYSFDVGSWHMVVLNSECAIVACAAGSAQELWLKNDLQTHPSSCTLAYWHRQESTPSKPFWADLYDAGADVVLNGHVHDYERFTPQNRTIASYDPVAGIRRFIVGTGGKSHQSTTSLPNAEVKENSTYGVLNLTLHATSYDWQFVPEAGKTFTDSGSAYCHKGLASSADLSLSKSDAPDPVQAGQLLTYTLTAQNQGPSSATNAAVTDTLPAGVTYDSATPSQGSCTESAGTVTCALGTLAGGATASVDVKVTPQGEGNLTNQASVSSDVADPDSTNNSASADTAVSAAGYPRPKGATPLLASLVPAYAACTDPNASHAPPLASSSCAPPVQASSYLTVGTLDANGAAAKSIGLVRFDVQIGQSPTPSDVIIAVNLTDVRCQAVAASCAPVNTAAGPDYTGELGEDASLRLTDKLNGPEENEPATVSDTSFPVTLPCAATADTSTGAACAVTTSANTVLPGSVQSGARAIWQLGPVALFDGGPDGVVSTADNSLFAVQGIFVP